MKIPIYYIRFNKYVIIGVCAMMFDLFLITLFIELINMNYYFAVVLGFLIAHSTNYIFQRKWNFKESQVSPLEGYIKFLSFGILGLVLILTISFLLNMVFKEHYLLIRIIAGSIAGITIFFLNYIWTFKLGHELKSSKK